MSYAPDGPSDGLCVSHCSFLLNGNRKHFLTSSQKSLLSPIFRPFYYIVLVPYYPIFGLNFLLGKACNCVIFFPLKVFLIAQNNQKLFL